jgi:hypothetical protein
MKLADFLKKSFFLMLALSIFLVFLTSIGGLIGNGKEAWTGLLIAYINFIVGMAILSWGIKKSDKYFYGSFFSGMFIRFGFMFVVLFVLIKILNFNKNVLIFSLLLAYFCFLFLEIWLIYRSSILRSS